MILLLDNFDSFTYNLVEYFYKIGYECDVVKNNVPLKQIDLSKYEAVVLSPGPCRPKDSGVLMEVLKESIKQELPILGICLGHQAIGELYGHKLVKAMRPMHGKECKLMHLKGLVFQGIKDGVSVIRYNSLVLEEYGFSELEVTAYSEGGEIMALEHPTKPIHAVQFHPEAILTEYGLQMLQNWTSLI